MLWTFRKYFVKQNFPLSFHNSFIIHVYMQQIEYGYSQLVE